MTDRTKDQHPRTTASDGCSLDTARAQAALTSKQRLSERLRQFALDIANDEPLGNILPLDAATRIDRLEAALWKYGKHLSSCTIHTVRVPAFSCSCGWLELRETLAGDALKPTEREQMAAKIQRLQRELAEAHRVFSGIERLPDETPAPLSERQQMMRERMLHDEELTEEEFQRLALRIALEAHEDRLQLWESLFTDRRTGARLSSSVETSGREEQK